MANQHYDSAFHSPYVALLIGAAVSLDVIALTFCSTRIYSANARTWIRWAKYNACWHAGLLLIYLVLIDILTAASQYINILITIPLPEWLHFLKPAWIWFADKFREHFIVFAAVGAMAFVWRQYSYKIIGIPTAPLVEDAPFFLRPIFKKLRARGSMEDTRFFWHLSACLVAVDMLALAAVVKSGEKLIQFPNGFDKLAADFGTLNQRLLESLNYEFLAGTAFVTAAVFVVVGALCFFSAYISNLFWKQVAEARQAQNPFLTAIFIVVLLRFLEPMIIFYFIIHSMGFLATGVPIHSPAFLLGSGFLLAALIQYVGFGTILDSAKAQVMAAHGSGLGGADAQL